MGELISLMLFVLSVVVGLPILIAARLFVRTRHLREDVEELRERLRAVELNLPGKIASEIPPAKAESYSEHRAEPAIPIEIPPPVAASYSEPSAPESPAPIRHAEPESLESRIGGRWLLNIGITAIVVGVAYFEKLAIDNKWIGETARVIQGGLLGAALIYAGSRFARRGYALYGQMMIGGGVAILYVSTYAAFNYYHLIDRPVAFTLMVGVTVIGALLADRHASQGLAVLAVGGGFVTPFLLPSNTDAQIALFTYVAIMIGGTVFLARRRDWPLLHVVSYVFTLMLVAAWADRFYTSEKYLRTELYLTAFCAMFVAIARSCRNADHGVAEFAAWLVWTAPIAYYAASLNILQDHPMALLVWVIAVALLGGVLSVRVGTGTGLALWAAAAVPLLAWTQPHAVEAWLRPGLVTIAALYAIGLAAQLRAAGEDRPASGLDITWIHLNALLMFAGAYFMLETTHLAITGPLGAMFAAWNGVLAAMFWKGERDRAVHFAALAFTLLSIAIALQFDGPAVTVGWAAEGAAIVALGLLEKREWLRAGGAILFTIAVLRALGMLLTPPPVNHVVFLNPRAACALLVVALCYVTAWLHRRDMPAPAREFAIGAGIVAAQVVSLVLLTTEIHAYFASRPGVFSRELLVSVTWAVYATALIVIGLQRRYAIVRYFAIALFGITIVKVFFSDLAELQRIYRVMSVIGLGITLLLSSYLYQRMSSSNATVDDLNGRR